MNRGMDSVLSVYSDTRAEYSKQLCVFLVPAFFQFFIELLERAKKDMSNEPKRVLWQFQNYLNEIHDWNMEKVHSEIQKINNNSGCDYLEDLITAVFIAHTKVLTAIRLSASKKKIEINVPKVEHFLFKVLCETSKLLWSSTYLFRDGISGIEKQQNYRNIEQLINEGILQAVRSLVPVKSILKDFINNDETGEDDSDDEKEEEQPIKELLNVDKIEENNNKVISEISNIETNQSENSAENKEITFSEFQPNIEQQINSSVEENTLKNEIIQPPQTIIIEDKPTVTFGEYNTIFDMGNPDNSDLIYESKDEKDDEEDDTTPALEILDIEGTPLSEGIDFENLNDENNESDTESLGADDFENLI